MEGEVETIEYNETLKFDILKLGNHVSKTSSSNDFLQTVFPNFTVVSIEYKNIFRHQNKNIMNRSSQYAETIWPIGQSEALRLQSGGYIIWEFHWK